MVQIHCSPLCCAADGDGNAYALDAQAGSLLWTFPTENRIWARPLILSDTVYVSSLDHHLYALDLETGQPRWEEPFEAGGAIASQPLAYDGVIYIGAFDSQLYALDQETGEQIWSQPFQGENWFWGTPASDGTTVYAGQEVSGVLRSTDDGVTWEPMNDGWWPPFQVRALLIHVDEESRRWLYAGTTEGVWRYLLDY